MDQLVEAGCGRKQLLVHGCDLPVKIGFQPFHIAGLHIAGKSQHNVIIVMLERPQGGIHGFHLSRILLQSLIGVLLHLQVHVFYPGADNIDDQHGADHKVAPKEEAVKQNDRPAVADIFPHRNIKKKDQQAEYQVDGYEDRKLPGQRPVYLSHQPVEQPGKYRADGCQYQKIEQNIQEAGSVCAHASEDPAAHRLPYQGQQVIADHTEKIGPDKSADIQEAVLIDPCDVKPSQKEQHNHANISQFPLDQENTPQKDQKQDPFLLL